MEEAWPGLRSTMCTRLTLLVHGQQPRRTRAQLLARVQEHRLYQGAVAEGTVRAWPPAFPVTLNNGEPEGLFDPASLVAAGTAHPCPTSSAAECLTLLTAGEPGPGLALGGQRACKGERAAWRLCSRVKGLCVYV